MPVPGWRTYSGIGLQVIVSLGIFILLGHWLDGYFLTETPWFTVGLALFGIVSLMIWVVVRFGK